MTMRSVLFAIAISVVTTLISGRVSAETLTIESFEDISGTGNHIDILLGNAMPDVQVVVTGGSPSYTYSLSGSLPGGIDINETTGQISGTPIGIGEFTITVTVVDNVGNSVQGSFTMSIIQRLSIVALADIVVQPDSSITAVQVSVSGGRGAYTYSLSGSPNSHGLSISSSGLITGTPTQIGTFTMTVTVNDEEDLTTPANETFSLGVYSIQLAEKFSPILILTKDPTDSDRKVIFPEPVEIMSAESADSLYFSIFGNDMLPLFQDTYHSMKPNQKLYFSRFFQSRYPGFDFSQNQFAYLPKNLIVTDSEFPWATPAHVKPHFEYPGNDGDSWYSYYSSDTHPKRGARFRNTAYVSVAQVGNNILLEYHYFYPFNEWLNNHEGDWQSIDVLVSSADTATANLVGIDYQFHGKNISYSSITNERIFDPNIKSAPAEGGTHPVVYVGAGSHAGYPTGGRGYTRGVLTENMTDDGVVLSTAVEDTYPEIAQPYDLIFLPNPNPGQPNMGLSSEMSWLGTGARWGTLSVPSHGNKENISPVGPFYKDWRKWNNTSSYTSGTPTDIFQQFPIVQDVTWSGTIALIGDIVVYPGATLRIEAGTTIKFQPQWIYYRPPGSDPNDEPADSTLTVIDIHSMNDISRIDIVNYGTLIANASSQNPIVFKSSHPNPTQGDWAGITNYGTLQMRNCEIREAVDSVRTVGNGAQTTLIDVEYINSGTGNLTAPPSATASKLALSDDVEFVSDLPDTFSVAQNYPNPFNPETTIPYGLPESVHVRLVIYNVLGQEIRTLVNDVKPAGYHRVVWDNKDDFGRSVSSGIYLYRIVAGDFVQTKKMLILK